MAEETQNINKLVTKENLAEFATGIGTKHKQYIKNNSFYLDPPVLTDNNGVLYVNVENLAGGCPYKLANKTEISSFQLIPMRLYNDDGSFIKIANKSNSLGFTKGFSSVVSILTKSSKSIVIEYCDIISSYEISCKKKDGVWSFTLYPLRLSMGLETEEFTPTDDYHPATKKYVDDSIKGVVFASPFISTDWVLNPDTTFYELSVNHNLNSSNLSVFSRNTVDNYDMFVDYEIVDENNIKIISDEACDCSVKIHAY